MKVSLGILGETMPCEGRILLFPEDIASLRADLQGKGILFGAIFEKGLGRRIGLKDDDWRRQGIIMEDRRRIFEWADFIAQVKQPAPEDAPFYRPGQGLCCFLHPNACANKKIADELAAKGVRIWPLEKNPASLYEMSKFVGRRFIEILERFREHSGIEWRDKNFVLRGARGTVGRHCIDNLLVRGVSPDRIFGFDVEAGTFTATDTSISRACHTFSVEDVETFYDLLETSSFLVLAGRDKEGKAPKDVKMPPLALLPHNSLIFQPNIDEGGSIDDEELCRITYWDDPFYRVRVGAKHVFLCNVPDIPGGVREGNPEDMLAVKESSRVLAKASLPYLVRTLREFAGSR